MLVAFYFSLLIVDCQCSAKRVPVTKKIDSKFTNHKTENPPSEYQSQEDGIAR